MELQIGRGSTVATLTYGLKVWIISKETISLKQVADMSCLFTATRLCLGDSVVGGGGGNLSLQTPSIIGKRQHIQK